MAGPDMTLDLLVSATDAVAESIQAGDWQRASELEIERLELLRRFVRVEMRNHGSLEHLRGELEILIACNNRLLGDVHHHRRQVLREACTVKIGRTAVAEYGR